MRPIDADELIKGRVENDPVVIAVNNAPTIAVIDNDLIDLINERNSLKCTCARLSDAIDEYRKMLEEKTESHKRLDYDINREQLEKMNEQNMALKNACFALAAALNEKYEL